MPERSEIPARDTADDAEGRSSAAGSLMFQYDSLQDRARKDFSDFQVWADANPDIIAEHFELYEQHIATAQREGRLSRRLIRPFTNTLAKSKKEQEYADYFGVTNLGHLPSEAQIATAQSWRQAVGSNLVPVHLSSPEDAVRYYAKYIPGDVPEDLIRWSGDRLKGLYRILPEFVVRDNGMEKVIRVMMGVVALAAAEAADTPEEERNERIARSIAPAYYYAATYPIVDDILQDSDYIQDGNDKSKYHSAILKGLSTGKDISESELPDHPLAEEMLRIYNEMRNMLPFDQYRGSYYALESMYRAQHDDANMDISKLSNEADLYAPITIKASLSRINGHMITGHDIGPKRSARMFRTLLRQQIADDQRDVAEDLRAGRTTPFTLQSTHPELGFGNPLFYHIAQEAYIWHQVYAQENPERVKHTLSKFGAYDMGYTLSTDAPLAEHMKKHFGDQGGRVDHLLRIASGIGRRALSSTGFSTPDKQLARILSEDIPERDPQSIDPRTYISDALSYVNEVLLKELSGGSMLDEVMRYALEAGGKRVRPALTLMLAESLDIPREQLEPLVISSELAHTASLVFDDLPAHDNATLRRGKEATHVKFPEYDAQLAGISMISHSIGVLGRLGADFPADRVNEVVEYTGTILGAKKLCLGQHMDLADEYSTSEEIIEMYNLKTSTMIEQALVPLMMLTERPQDEIENMKQYAYHTGIVFQLRDDILDAVSSAEVMGKNSGQDSAKQNIITTLGIEGAQSMLDTHLQGAVESLSRLPFPTDLLEGVVTYFATRRK